MFEYSLIEVQQQLASQPDALVYWVRWLGIINLWTAFFFIRRRQAQWVLASIVFIMATNIPLALTFGLVKVVSIPHLMVWIPLIVYLANELRSGRVKHPSIFGTWIGLVAATDLVSVIFDIRDSAEYLMGDTGLVDVTTANPPFVIFAIILASLVALIFYVRDGATLQQGENHARKA